jgi:hypothetical protein
MRYGSDIDIALYFENEPGIYELGNLVNRLEEEIKNKVDIIGLNNLDKTNPLLAQSILSTGKLIYNIDDKTHNNFKRAVFLQYLDFKYVSDKFEEAFNSRKSNNNFAVFDK